MKKLGLLLAASAASALVVAASASAARTADTVTCGDTTYALTVTSTSNDNSVAWGVGTISGGQHLIPVRFAGSAVDLTTGETLFAFDQAKGNGNGMHNQQQISCVGPADREYAGALGIPGVDPGDLIEVTFAVDAVLKA